MKRLLLTGLCLLAVSLYPAGLAQAAWQPELLVSLKQSAGSVRLSANMPVVLRRLDNKKVLWEGKARENAVLTFGDKGWELNGRKLAKADSAALELVTPDDKLLARQVSTLDYKSYRGALRLLPRKGKIQVLNRVPVEEYLRGSLT